MAHFAELDSNNQVVAVYTFENELLDNASGYQNESTGETILRQRLSTTNRFIQTSYNNNFRKNYAGTGYTYDATRDAFIAPKPYASWVLDEQTCRWKAPQPHPQDGNYTWDEQTTQWVNP